MGFESAGESCDHVVNFAERNVQERGNGPDAVERTSEIDLLKPEVQRVLARDFTTECGQFFRGIERGYLISLVEEVQRVSPRSASGIQNMAPWRNVFEKPVVEVAEVHVQGALDVLLGVLIVVRNGLTLELLNCVSRRERRWRHDLTSICGRQRTRNAIQAAWIARSLNKLVHPCSTKEFEERV